MICDKISEEEVISQMKKSVILAIFALVFAVPLQAQVARLVHFQGTVTDSTGNAFAGSTDLTFSIYGRLRSGQPFWSETHDNVQVTDGTYSVLLGSKNPLKLSFYEYFLEVSSDHVATGERRVMIVGSGYNFRLWFLFSAYTVVWLALFLYIFSISRRQKRIISELEILAEVKGSTRP